MDPLYIWGISLVVLISIAIISIYVVPEQRKVKKQKNKPRVVELPAEQKDWKEACLKLEKHLQVLRESIGQLEKQSAVKDKQVLIEQVKIKKLEEKLDKERVWHQKEEVDVEKRRQELTELRNELTRVQQVSGQEHSQLIKFEKEMKELRGAHSNLEEQHRKVETERLQLVALVEGYKVQIAQLKRENNNLSQQQEDSQWVAKTDYIRMEQQFKEAKTRLDKMLQERQG